ncbi:hypothetical protein MTR67_003090 [Solanum verrucosum]|uniref:Integrase zinc-binding domain-containing protein n=1 Tax=Solanum verrucosum TaxID=315347 RepID=A0AAF0PUY4_SOLVR|nr:hypothetical protein MTR67_003090 [Solanum verrucosum]
MGSLTANRVEERPLARDFYRLANSLVRLQISKKIGDKVMRGQSKVVVLYSQGVWRIEGKIKVDELIRLILEEAHCSRYYIHSGETNMYHDLSQHYWWYGCFAIMRITEPRPKSQKRKVPSPNPCDIFLFLLISRLDKDFERCRRPELLFSMVEGRQSSSLLLRQQLGVEIGPELKAEVAEDHVPPEFEAPLFQETFLRMLCALENLSQGSVLGSPSRQFMVRPPCFLEDSISLLLQ